MSSNLYGREIANCCDQVGWLHRGLPELHSEGAVSTARLESFLLRSSSKQCLNEVGQPASITLSRFLDTYIVWKR